MKLSKNKKKPHVVVWYTEYLGVGYLYDGHDWSVFLLFEKSSDAGKVWNNEVKPLDEKSLKMRFVELNEDYEFILYSEPFSTERPNWAFYRHLDTSETYKIFKQRCGGQAYFRFGIKKGQKVTLFKASKLVTDIKFLKPNQIARNTPEWIAREVQRKIKQRKTYVV